VLRKFTLAFVALALSLGISATATRAQSSEIKEKPPMYSYVGNWDIPRAQWGDMEKSYAGTQAIMDQGVSSGALVGYGHDQNVVHTVDGSTHDEWWSAMSIAGLLNVLDQIYKSGSPTSPVLASATKHWDSIYVSHYYNWHSGTWKGVYTHASSYKLKTDAPNDAIDLLSKNLIVPLMEKMLADGTIHEYEIDTEAVHTQAPGTFWLFYIGANAEAIDKVNAALRETMKANPLGGPAFGSMVDFTEHRDEIVRTTATYK
jgi:hypothetical protein